MLQQLIPKENICTGMQMVSLFFFHQKYKNPPKQFPPSPCTCPHFLEQAGVAGRRTCTEHSTGPFSCSMNLHFCLITGVVSWRDREFQYKLVPKFEDVDEKISPDAHWLQHSLCKIKTKKISGFLPSSVPSSCLWFAKKRKKNPGLKKSKHIQASASPAIGLRVKSCPPRNKAYKFVLRKGCTHTLRRLSWRRWCPIETGASCFASQFFVCTSLLSEHLEIQDSKCQLWRRDGWRQGKGSTQNAPSC